MDTLEKKILEAFDLSAGVSAVGGGSVAGPIDLSQFGGTPEGERVLAQLIERGWLRPGNSPGTYVRTEDGRLQLAGPRDVTIYSRPGCHLCEEAKSRIGPVLEEFGARLVEINIDDDPVLRARYDYDVPVVFIGHRKVAKHRVDVAQFRHHLATGM